jgi:hypothetical protein
MSVGAASPGSLSQWSALIPSEWTSSLIYYQSFDTPDGAPDVNTANLQIVENLAVSEGGMLHDCGAPGSDPNRPQRFVLLKASDAALSPVHPLTVSFWWTFPSDLQVNGGCGLLSLNGRGYISDFMRGGPWCGLTDSAAAVQVYDLPGIANVNGVYDTHIRDTVGKAGVWHHTALVVSAASLVTVYCDGKQVFQTRTTGRGFQPGDGFDSLQIGGGVLVDDIAILNRQLSAQNIDDYFGFTRTLAQVER